MSVLVDTDMGCDDALALVAAALFNVKKVSTTGGNVSAGQAVSSARYVLNRSGLEAEILKGIDPPGLQPWGHHGVDGLGGWAGSEGHDVTASALETHELSDDLAVAALGPLSNWRASNRRIVALGGCAGCPEGVIDRNVLADATAAASLKDPWWVPLRVAADVAVVSPVPGSWFEKASRSYAAVSGPRWGLSGSFPAFDVAVVCAALDIGKPVWSKLDFRVNGVGLQFGHGGKPAHVLERFAEADAVRQIMDDALATLG